MLDNEEKRHEKLQRAEMRFLRSGKGRTRLDKIRKENIRKEKGVFSINDRIRRYRQDWLEHVEKKEEGRVPKRALWYRPKGRRDPGRPRRKWNPQKLEQANGLILELEKKKKPQLVRIIFKYSVRTAKKTPHFTITKINWSMQFKEIIAVYSENHTKHINTKFSVIECYSEWYIQLPLGFK
jgi:hypothetical protein